jgi:hypothetical protein
MHVEYRVFQLMCTIVRGDRAEAAAAAAVRLDEMTTRLFNCLGPAFMSKGSVQSLKLLLSATFIKLALGRDAECLKVSPCRYTLSQLRSVTVQHAVADQTLLSVHAATVACKCSCTLQQSNSDH